LGCRRRRMEPRSTTHAGICSRGIAEPGLSNSIIPWLRAGESETVYKPATSPAPRSASAAS
jgi:hypothetical protein